MRMATIAAFLTLLMSILFIAIAPARAGVICSDPACPGRQALDETKPRTVGAPPVQVPGT